MEWLEKKGLIEIKWVPEEKQINYPEEEEVDRV